MKKYLSLFILLFILVGASIGVGILIRELTTSGVMSEGAIAIYEDINGTVNMTSIDWGVVPENDDVIRTGYIKNTGNVPLTLNVSTGLWNPAIAEQYIIFSTNFVGEVLQPGQTFTAQFILLAQTGARDNLDAFSFTVFVIGDDGL